MSCALQGSPYLITRTQGLKPALKFELAERSSEVTPVTFSVAGSHVNVKATLSDCYTVVFCIILLSLILNLEVYWTWTCP